MPRVKAKTRKDFTVTDSQYWALVYLSELQNRTRTEIAEEGIKYAVKIISENEDPRRPKKPVPKRTKHVVTVRISRETLLALTIVKINNGMKWSVSDFLRYGLNKTISSYASRYPDLKIIVDKYKEK